MRILLFQLCLGSALALMGTACHVSNRLYNPSDNRSSACLYVGGCSIEAVETRPIKHNGGEVYETAHLEPDCQPDTHACVAFVEFDDFGEAWDPGQLRNALLLIDRSKHVSIRVDDVPPLDGPSCTARTPGWTVTDPDPIVVVFVHGWKNNARTDSERAAWDRNANGNVVGFEGVLEYLKRCVYPGHAVVGLYGSWRGDLVSEAWPVSRQVTFFDREGAALRIPGTGVSSSLTQIMTAVHQEKANAHLIMVGHSFGGLILERALSQPMADYLLRDCQRGLVCNAPWADLVVFVNSAAAASEGKQMLDLMKEHHVQEWSASSTPTRRSPANARPLFLSISSVGDAATRSFVPIGHGPSYLGRRIDGSVRDYWSPQPPEISSQGTYYLNTLAHLAPLQSHVILDEKIAATAVTSCGDRLYRRVLLPNGHTYDICERTPRWNDTAYWAMEMPTTIVPDHSGIFNANFVGLMQAFLLSPTEMSNPNLRPVLEVIKRAGG